MVPDNTPTIRAIVGRTARVMIPAWIALWLSVVLPSIALNSALAVLLYMFTETGDVTGVICLSMVLVVVVIFRTNLPWPRRAKECLVHLVVLGALLGGGAYVDARFVKTFFKTPRPHIVRLAQTGALGMSAEAFYALGDTAARRAYLRDVLHAPDFEAVALHPWIRHHWLVQTSYSLPSGHAFSSMMFATYSVAMGLAFIPVTRRWPFYALAAWAPLIGFSRVLLNVHRPIDVLVGGLLGFVIGGLAMVIALTWLQPIASSSNGGALSVGE